MTVVDDDTDIQEDGATEDFPALSSTLTEARRLYDLERDRKQSLENKAAAIGATAASILLFVSSFRPLGDWFSIGTVVLAAVSIVLSVVSLRLQVYKQPPLVVG